MVATANVKSCPTLAPIYLSPPLAHWLPQKLRGILTAPLNRRSNGVAVTLFAKKRVQQGNAVAAPGSYRASTGASIAIPVLKEEHRQHLKYSAREKRDTTNSFISGIKQGNFVKPPQSGSKRAIRMNQSGQGEAKCPKTTTVPSPAPHTSYK